MGLTVVGRAVSSLDSRTCTPLPPLTRHPRVRCGAGHATALADNGSTPLAKARIATSRSQPGVSISVPPGGLQYGPGVYPTRHDDPGEDRVEAFTAATRPAHAPSDPTPHDRADAPAEGRGVKKKMSPRAVAPPRAVASSARTGRLCSGPPLSLRPPTHPPSPPTAAAVSGHQRRRWSPPPWRRRRTRQSQRRRPWQLAQRSAHPQPGLFPPQGGGDRRGGGTL